MAGVQETAQWENHIYRIEENDPVHGGENGITNKPTKQLANRTLYLRRLLTEAGQRINPKKITATSRNSNDLTGHTHEIDLASTTTKGLVQLTNDTGLDSDVLALTAKAGKAIAQAAAAAQVTANSKWTAVDANTNRKGIVQLYTGFSSNSQTHALTAKSGKDLNDKIQAVDQLARSKWTAVNASTSTRGIVQLTNDTGLDSDVLALTAKAGKAIAQAAAQAQVTANGKWTAVNASSSQRGIVYVSSSVTSNNETYAANSKAVKTAYDKAVEAKQKADQAEQTALNRRCLFSIMPQVSQNYDYDVTNRADWLTAMNATSNGYYVRAFHGNQITRRFNGLPIDGVGYSVELFYQGGYSVIRLHYTNGRQFYANVNMNHETLTVNWKEVQTAAGILRTPKTRQTTHPGVSGYQYTTDGVLITQPDGRIVQIFHLKGILLNSFPKEPTAVSGTFNGQTPHHSGSTAYTIGIPLWTAMPNKILTVNAQILRASTPGMASQTYNSEASEWVCAWMLLNNLTNRGQVTINAARISGSGNLEPVDLYVVVEGY